jgi:hypothetical protein
MPRPRIRFATGLILIAMAATACGCASSEFESDVAGTVTLDGQPVGPGTVVFVPPDKASNPPTGTVQVNGTYFLKSNRARGLHPGHYTVSVSILHQDPIPPGQRSTVPAKLVSPKKYSDPATSGLEYDVKRGKNTIDIELSSK